MERMERVRNVQLPNTVIPPVNRNNFNDYKSQEELERLRAMKHQAFHRHRQNEDWVFELIRPTNKSQIDITNSIENTTTTNEEIESLNEKIMRIKRENEALKSQLNAMEEKNKQALIKSSQLISSLSNCTSKEDIEAYQRQIASEKHKETSYQESKIIKL